VQAALVKLDKLIEVGHLYISAWFVLCAAQTWILNSCLYVADTHEYEHTPRLLSMSNASGTFEAIEVLNPARCDGNVEEDDVVSPFPFLQVDLYLATQPG